MEYLTPRLKFYAILIIESVKLLILNGLVPLFLRSITVDAVGVTIALPLSVAVSVADCKVVDEVEVGMIAPFSYNESETVPVAPVTVPEY